MKSVVSAVFSTFRNTIPNKHSDIIKGGSPVLTPYRPLGGPTPHLLHGTLFCRFHVAAPSITKRALRHLALLLGRRVQAAEEGHSVHPNTGQGSWQGEAHGKMDASEELVSPTRLAFGLRQPTVHQPSTAACQKYSHAETHHYPRKS